MQRQDIQNLLIIGLDTAAIAKSAHRAGYTVYVADHYGDQDLRQACKHVVSIVQQKSGKTTGRLSETFTPRGLLQLAKKIGKTFSIDAILLASGLEDNQQTLAKLENLAPIIGNSPKIIQKIRTAQTFFQILKKLGVPHPKTTQVSSYKEARKAAKDIGYPVLMKPIGTLGGVGIIKVETQAQLGRDIQQIIEKSNKGLLIQEYILGAHTSVSFISTRAETVTLTINKQLLGNRTLGQKEPFGYCGNITPFQISINPTLQKRINYLTHKIASGFKLTGSNGIDTVITRAGVPYVIEVNPRFQGTIECIERVLGINLVKSHVDACLQSRLPSLKERKLKAHCVRLILYARQRSIAPDLDVFEEVRDVPYPQAIIEEGEPLCSIVVKEKTRSAMLRKANILVNRIYKMVKPTAQL